MQFDFSRDYFSLFGLPVGFEVDNALLTERYRELQKVVHPDKHSHQTDAERRLAVQMSAQLNSAFDTLKKPLARGVYMLSLQGVDINSETDTRMDGGFLMKQMMWRESLEELDDMDDLDELSGEVSSEKKSNLTALASALGESDWDQARNLVRQLQFIEKMQAEIETAEANLSDY